MKKWNKEEGSFQNLSDAVKIHSMNDVQIFFISEKKFQYK